MSRWKGLIGPVIFGVLFLAAVWAIVVYVPKIPTYADGYCTALGGVKITEATCNVNGRVVEVK